MKAIARKTLLLGGMAAAFLSLAPATSDEAAAADRLRLECRAEGQRDISMQARYEVRSQRKKFTVEMEAAPNSGFQAGQRIVFFVAGENVGADRLETLVGGDLVGELNLDTTAGPGDDAEPFPAGFPAVQRGTRVQIRSGGQVVLGCALR